jgi:hypothetical protein
MSHSAFSAILGISPLILHLLIYVPIFGGAYRTYRYDTLTQLEKFLELA